MEFQEEMKNGTVDTVYSRLLSFTLEHLMALLVYYTYHKELEWLKVTRGEGESVDSANADSFSEMYKSGLFGTTITHLTVLTFSS